ncbi:MAG: glycoside hydrolase family 28 protein [Ignavibacteriaceae bacterium]
MKNNKYLIISIAFMLSSGTILGKSIFGSLNKLSKTNSANTIPGAYGDGIHYDTKAIQAAIDSVIKIGGGIVHFSNGKYLTGPFTIGSNVTLQIDSSATILASQNVYNYYQPGADTTKPPSSLQNFISAKYAVNIKITGGGTIDGQGQPWWAAYNKSTGLPLRPRLIEIDHSQHILIDSVTLQNSPMFHLCPQYCYDVNINHITILAPSNSPNTDGIDPAQCHHVRISYCKIDNGDDDIAIGASHNDPSWPGPAANTDIIISHCTFLHGHGCSIGSYTVGGVDSMLVDSCTFNGTDNGFRIKSQRGRGGDIRGITYSNITMTNVKYPIYFSEYYPSIPSQTDPSQTVNSTTPHYHDITIQNLVSTGSPYGGVIVGVPEMPITNIHLKNVSISSSAGIQVRNASVDTSNVNIKVSSGSPYILEISGTVGSVTFVKNEITPSGYTLEQNYPNPFNPTTQIRFNMPKESVVTIKIYNMLGKEIKTLIRGEKAEGEHSVTWNGTNDRGIQVASGTYFYRINTNNFTQVKKMIFMK